ncbi:MAG: hypothetical protein ACMG55_00895 [Microcoleus sp.]
MTTLLMIIYLGDKFCYVQLDSQVAGDRPLLSFSLVFSPKALKKQSQNSDGEAVTPAPFSPHRNRITGRRPGTRRTNKIENKELCGIL